MVPLLFQVIAAEVAVNSAASPGLRVLSVASRLWEISVFVLSFITEKCVKCRGSLGFEASGLVTLLVCRLFSLSIAVFCFFTVACKLGVPCPFLFFLKAHGSSPLLPRIDGMSVTSAGLWSDE